MLTGPMPDPASHSIVNMGLFVGLYVGFFLGWAHALWRQGGVGHCTVVCEPTDAGS